MTRHQKSSKRRRRGTAAVEFAIVAPLFFLLVLGSIEIGRALMVQQVLTNASRVGAREAIMPNISESAVIATVQNYASGASVSGTSVSVVPSPATAQSGDMITVTITVDFATVSWTPAPWFMGGTTLTASSVMRKEGFE